MEEIMDTYSTTFYACVQDWPDDIKEDIYKLYAYLRVCDEMVEGEKTLHDFKHWREVIEEFYRVSDKYQFDGEWLSDFHISMYQDLIKKEHTVTSMLEYCKGSAESVGMMISKMMGCDPRSEPHARALGRAYQIINFVRDYREDVERGYHYIDGDDLAFYCRLYQKEIDFAMKGIDYIPEGMRKPILMANEKYDEVAMNVLTRGMRA